MMMKKIGKMMVLVAIAVVALAPLASATYVLTFDESNSDLGIATDGAGGEWKGPFFLLGTAGSTFDAGSEIANLLFCHDSNPIWTTVPASAYMAMPHVEAGVTFTYGYLGAIGGDFTGPQGQFEEDSTTPFTGPEYQNQDVMWDMEATYPIGGEATYVLLRATDTGPVFESMITVPEPATMALLGLGGLLLRRRRRA